MYSVNSRKGVSWTIHQICLCFDIFLGYIIRIDIFLGLKVPNPMSNFGNSKWWIQNGSKFLFDCVNYHLSVSRGLFGVADSKSEVKFWKFKMTDPNFSTFLVNVIGLR